MRLDRSGEPGYDRLARRNNTKAGNEQIAMEAKSEVTLVATVHQPDERLASLAAAQLPALAARYAEIVRDAHARR